VSGDQEYRAVVMNRESAHEAITRGYAHAKCLLANGDNVLVVVKPALEAVRVAQRNFLHGVVEVQIAEQVRMPDGTRYVMFQIETFTEALLATVTSRPELHGDEKKPAVSLGLELTLANTALDCIDPKIRHALYTAVEGQDQLPGVEPATPVLRCNSFDRHTLPAKYEGWTLQVDDGIDETTPLTFGGCKVDKLSVEAKQGGSVVLRMRVGTSDLDACARGCSACTWGNRSG
jgi:hypothetical protein